MNHTPIIHIGMPKTATSALQKDIFANADIFLPLGRFGPGGDKCASGVIRELLWEGLYLDELQYNKRKTTYLAEINRLLTYAKDKKLCPVISQEIISIPTMYSNDYEVVFSRLKDLFGECQILMFTREQGSFLKSFYSTFVTDMGASLSFREFLFINENCANHQYNMARCLDYNHIVTVLERHFSKVSIFVYEDIVQNFSKNIREAMQKCKVNIPEVEIHKTNASRSPLNINRARSLNNQFPRGASARIESHNLSFGSNFFNHIKRKIEEKKPITKDEAQIYNQANGQRHQQMLTMHQEKMLGNISQILRIFPDPVESFDIEKEFLKSLFGESNRLLARKYDLSFSSHGYSGFE